MGDVTDLAARPVWHVPGYRTFFSFNITSMSTCHCLDGMSFLGEVGGQLAL